MAMQPTQGRRYWVETWNLELQQWTPQIGVPHGPHTLWSLRQALRLLRTMGYQADRDDNYTLVYAEGES